jgi:hypothetical protein
MSEQQIEQVWYTWSKRGLEGTGLGVRAASRAFQDMRSPRMQALLPHIRSYQLPSDFDPYTTRQEDAPVCLAFFKEGHDQILLQKAFLAQRDDKGRAGLFFVHALVGFPAYFSAREAISLWKAGFWVTSDTYDPAVGKPLREDSDELGALPYTPLTPKQRVLKSENLPLKKYMQSKLPSFAGLEEALLFVLRAFLLQRRAQEQQQKAPKIYIAALPQTVAALLQGLTHALPRGLLNDLTFSTYEQRVEQSPALIVGTCRSSMRAAQSPASRALASLLSPAAFQGQALVLNSDTGENSPLPAAGPLEARFTAFAVESLVSGVMDGLREVVSDAEKQKITTIDAFLEFYELGERAKQDQLSSEDVYRILCTPPRAAQLLSRKPVRDIALQLLQDDFWWKKGMQKAMAELVAYAQPGDELSTYLEYLTLGQTNQDNEIVQDGLASAAAQALLDQDEERALVWLRRLERFAPPGKQPMIWQFLITWVGEYHPRALPFADRFWLLQQWQQAEPELDPVSIQPWLEVEIAHLPGLLALHLPEAWSLAALAPLAHQDAKAAAGLLATYPSLADQILKQFIVEKQGEAARDFFEAYVSRREAQEKIGLLSRLFDPRQGDANIAYGLLRVAHLTAPELSALLANVEHAVFQKALATLLLADHNWWQTEGRGTLAAMREQANAGQKMQQVVLLHLEKPVSEQLHQALEALRSQPQQETSEQTARDMIELLAFAAPPAILPGPWMSLLSYVSKEAASRFSWAIRSQLLSCWARLLPLPAQHMVQPWLEVRWEEADTFFLLKLDETWQRSALLGLLALQPERLGVPFNRQTTVDVVGVVKKHAHLFENLLVKIVTDHASPNQQDRTRRRQVASFFSSLATSGYPSARKMRLLDELLRAAADDGELLELLLQEANFSPEELHTFIEEGPFLEGLLRRNPLYTPLVSWMVVYVRELSAADQDRLEAQEFQSLSVLVQAIAYQPPHQQEQLKSAVAELANKAFNGVLAAFGGPIDESLGRFWLSILEVVAPPASNEDSWRPFTYLLEPARPRLTPATRHALLHCWAMIPSIDASLVLPWLQIPWTELDRLLARPLPAEWYQVSFLALLRAQAAPLTQEDVKIVVAHAPHVEFCLQNLIQEKTPWGEAARSYLHTGAQSQALWGIAVNFFWHLAASPAFAERKMALLHTLLQAALEQPIVADRLLQGARLHVPNETTTVLESYAQWLGKAPDIPGPLAEQIEQYLGSLPVDALWQPEPARLLAAALAIPSNVTSTRLYQVQVRAGNWRLIERFLGSPTTEKEALEMLAHTLVEVPANRRAEVFAAVTRALAAAIRQETHLRLVLATLGPRWQEQGLSLLRQLVTRVGEVYSAQQYPPQRLALYAQAVCAEAAAAPTPEQQQANLDLLDTFLARVGKEAKLGIDKEAEGWASKEARSLWQAYRQRRKPSKTLMRGVHSLGGKGSGLPFFKKGRAGTVQNTAAQKTKTLPARAATSGRPGLGQRLAQNLRTWQGRLIFYLFAITLIFVFVVLVWAVMQLR